MADQRSIAGYGPLLFRFENALQMARLSWYIDVQNLANGTCSSYWSLAIGLVILLGLMKAFLFKVQCSKRNPFLLA